MFRLTCLVCAVFVISITCGLELKVGLSDVKIEDSVDGFDRSNPVSEVQEVEVDQESNGNDLHFANPGREKDYFIPHGLLSGVASIDIVKELPMTYYFDVLLGKFRFGILGENLVKLRPELVSRVTKKSVNKNSNDNISYSVDVVESQSIFTIGMSAVQHFSELIQSSRQEGNKIHSEYELINDSLSALKKLYDEALIETSLDIHTKRESIELNSEMHDLLLRQQTNQKERKMMSVNSGVSVRTEMQKAQSFHLLNETLYHLQTIKDLKEEHLKSLNQIKGNRLFMDIKKEREMLEFNFMVDIERMKKNLEETHLYSHFRIEEEKRIDKETEQSILNVMTAEHELASIEIGSVINTVVEELKLFTSQIFGNWKDTLRWSLTVLFVALFVTFFYEFASMIRVIILKITNKKVITRYNQNRKSLLRSILQRIRGIPDQNLHKIDNVILKSNTKESCLELIDCLKEGASKSFELQHVLIYGDPGTGKSICADALAYDSGIQYITLSVPEFLGLGSHAAVYIFDLLNKIKRGKTPTIVIIDEADDIILERNDSISSNGFTQGCFYVLLQAMRESSLHLSVIVTTSLALSEIDTAILDRIDRIHHLSLPDEYQRLDFGLKRSYATFHPYLSSNEIDNIKSNLENFDETSSIHSSPETDIPSTFDESAITSINDVKNLLAHNSIDNDEFDALKCMKILNKFSAGWSFRELEKLFTSTVSAALGTQKCRVTNTLLLSELLVKYRENVAVERRMN